MVHSTATRGQSRRSEAKKVAKPSKNARPASLKLPGKFNAGRLRAIDSTTNICRGSVAFVAPAGQAPADAVARGCERHADDQPTAVSAPVVYVIRHGEGQHQSIEERKKIKPHLGPALTQSGISQARALRPQLKLLTQDASSTLVVSSNLLRAVQTALVAFPKTPIVVQPLARERIANELDHPAELRALQQLTQKSGAKAQLDLWHYEYALKREGSHSAYLAGIWADDCIRENGRWANSSNEFGLNSRAAELTSWLEAQNVDRIFLVSHGAFLERLTGDTYMGNCEIRKYSIKDGVWQAQM
eukprot:gnl/MRDRNA2_/MRDRNA2_86508_c2_seq1.p1 gnl/MRDRNA2_/MRDRNA2_86508_c2~~gnl/MRDRNA2_/MRDRNA2_86508_c2_seq1.p1  ORF type:complete len:301 (+),score=59.94 gnl/MRDRNA2_/MRDRNA2_86508_c2_seq1:70-972(+)